LRPATPDRPEPHLPERLRDGYVLTCDPGRVDVDRVHAWLSDQAYWAMGRERSVVERSIAGSRPYSVYAGEQQAAFARVVTDGATFAWVCDVFVDEAHRGRGLGTWLVRSILQDCEAAGVPRCVLGTKDAHDVYRRCGFTSLHWADRWMEVDLRQGGTAAG
jgi:GNAT superfamily N-acetyltransferase